MDPILLALGMVIAGLVLLYFGAEALVGGASSLALRLGITPLIVGLTVVSFGTSAPELLVGLIGSDDVNLGNVVGSNIANIMLILGAAATISPLKIESRVVTHELPIMLAATGLFIGLSLDGALTRIDGIILLLAMVGYIAYMFAGARRDMKRMEAIVGDELSDVDPNQRKPIVDVLLMVGGIVGLALGASWMVNGSTTIASSMGVSELVIALSIVAIGTSLPELATSVVAAFRGEADISVGNVVGSNVFNLLFVMGVVACFGTIVVGEDALRIDLWVMAAISVLLWPLLRTGHSLKRWEGILMVVGYVAYLVSMFMR
ncbi:calcium/sodium antiporter [Lujinxingia vulgaris]|uniref:Calcium/sodium antiporter n=1 Tax=Lujinxingia vulgaris TaxID=2600176 RepID=A0A5C6XJL3_9DELT|nr:calcium/sodium antiporter [Lujinxingia vulgaris]TXD41627.1 calcium/sodium antiporter [Lujinxingia vulgaris]